MRLSSTNTPPPPQKYKKPLAARLMLGSKDGSSSSWPTTLTDPTNPAEAQQIQLAAQKLNSQVLKPVAGVSYIKLAGTRPQAEALSAFLSARYENLNEMLLGYAAVLDDLVFKPNSFQRFEAAIQELGEHLGFTAHRPEADFGKGPDNLWAVGNTHFLIIECKNEATADQISKEYVDKSSGRRNWFGETYGPGCQADSLMVHPSKIVSRYASADPNLRILTPAKLEDLKKAVRTLSTSIKALGSFGDVQGIAKALTYLGLTGDLFVPRFTETFVMEK